MKSESWAFEVLRGLTLSNEGQDFLYSRGVEEDQMSSIKTWECPDAPCPDSRFCRSFGSRGESLRGSLVFPYFNLKGSRVLGFECRSLKEKKFSDVRFPSSYWNPVFFGLDKAAQRVWNPSTSLWVVEGIFDALAMDSVLPEGHAVVATLTARLDRRHISFIERFCGSEVFLMYDNDRAGREGTAAAMKKLKGKNIPCTEISYMGGKDPNEILMSAGKSGLREVLRSYLF